jgi:thiol:disulfide interchange protein DsbD
MKSTISFLLTGLTLLFVNASLVAQSHVDAQLISSHKRIEVGKPFKLGIHLKMSDHWHTYWENPGSSGLPTVVKWEKPEGLTIGPIEYSMGKKFVDDAGYVTYGYDDEALLIASAVLEKELPELNLKGKVSWLECSGMCIPGDAVVSLKIGVGAMVESKENALFDKYEKLIPVSFNEDAPFGYQTSYDFKEDQWKGVLTIFPAKGHQIELINFTPGRDEHSEMKTAQLQGSVFKLTYEPFTEINKSELKLYGILEIKESGKTRYFRLPLYPEIIFTQKAESSTPPTHISDKEENAKGFLYVLLIGFLGGLILNLMPCVLPVLSLKVFSIIKEAGESAARRIQFGWMYALGIMFSFAVLAGFLIVAKAAGEGLGIGFQFQNPGFVIGMVVLIFVMALSFVGVFEFSAPQSEKIQGLAKKTGLMGAFYQGMLMTILSTPCTAPGLGAAYGWAVTADTWQILLIFEAIALGLATPYLILCYSPKLLKFLPKPGVWMDYFKVIMGFLLFATVIWLLNTLMNLSGETAITGTLILLLFIACAAWIHGKTYFMGPKTKGIVINILLILAGIYLGLFKFFDINHPTEAKTEYEETLRLTFLSDLQQKPGGGDLLIKELESRKTTRDKIAWIPYSPRALTHFRDQGKIVFLDFTAEWCATCKVNEKLVIDTQTIRNAFVEDQVITMKVDFTDRNEEILQFMHSFDRAGVPIYVIYPGTRDPVLLPETITSGMVLDGLANAKGVLNP